MEPPLTVPSTTSSSTKSWSVVRIRNPGGFELSPFLLQESAPPDDRAAVRDFLKSVSERSALLKLTSGAMVKAAADFVHICKTDGKRWTKYVESKRPPLKPKAECITYGLNATECTSLYLLSTGDPLSL